MDSEEKMISEEQTKDPVGGSKLSKPKNPKRVAAGKKGVEARKLKAELKRKEAELLKKENMKLKQITKDSDDDAFQNSKLEITKDSYDDAFQTNEQNSQKINVYKNYIPLCLSIVVVGLGFYFLKINKTENQSASYDGKTINKKEEYNSFEF